ncbi:DUF2304 domain-containing protein [Paenibacillus sp. Marseille-Q7038]
MNLNVYFVSFCISLAFATTILYLIRKRKLKEQYALLWLLMSAIMMILSLFPSILDELAVRIHIFYAPSLLYLLSVVAILFILLHLTITVSSLTNRVVVLTQTLGLQEDRIQKLEKQMAEKAKENSRLSRIEEEERGIAIPDFSQSSGLSLKQSYNQGFTKALDLDAVPPHDPNREEIR